MRSRAEQGDPIGPAYCGLTLLRCIAAGRRAVAALGEWVCDAWYMDGGQVLVPPPYVAAFLEAFDFTPQQLHSLTWHVGDKL